MGRKSKYTPEIHQRMVVMLRVGNFRETAAAACGIAARTMRDWLKRGAADEEPFATFADDCLAAEAEAEARGVAAIAKAGEKDWRALAWILERRSAKRWLISTKLEHSGPDGNAMKTGVVVMPPVDSESEDLAA
ncbi:MAG: hypothetical protein R3B07_35810 [Polyangiaceae bacterium]